MPVAADLYYFNHVGGATEADAVIFIHGAGGTHLHWPPEARRLPGRTIYAIDLPGHGKSPGPGEQTIAAYTDQLLNWMEAIGLQRAAFVGHSMGSAIALTMAIHHAPQVRALVLLGSGVRLTVNPEILSNVANPASYPLVIERVIGWSFSPQASPRLVEMASRRMAETRPAVLAGDFMACDQFNIMEEVAQVRCPTLVLCGEDDKMTPPRNSLYLTGKIQGARLSIIPEAGHMVMLEQPKAVAAALSEFFDSLL